VGFPPCPELAGVGNVCEFLSQVDNAPFQVRAVYVRKNRTETTDYGFPAPALERLSDHFIIGAYESASQVGALCKRSPDGFFKSPAKPQNGG